MEQNQLAPSASAFQVPSLLLPQEEIIKAMLSSVYPGASPESAMMVLAWCKAQNKDPLKKPVHIVPMTVKEKDAKGKVRNVKRDVVMQGIGDLRTDAARTGQFAGLDEAQWGPDVELTLGGEDKEEWDDNAGGYVKRGKWPTEVIRVPEWCSITVYRLVNGVRCPFPSGRVYWEETYATAGGKTSLPNEMWRKRRRGQLEKCAEALALRRAFPECGAGQVREEMEGRILDLSGEQFSVVSEPLVPMPQAAATASAPLPAAEPSAPAAPPEPAGEPAAPPPAAPPPNETAKAAEGEERKASAGEIANVKKRLGDKLPDCMKALGITCSVDEITLSQFKAMRGWKP